jgi:lysozyme family protein
MSFDAAFAIVVGVEGGYTNDPQDPGGETKFGISKRAYPELDIANLTIDQAKAIYQRDYWDRCACDTMTWERALCVFDTAVNQGQGTARALNVQSADVPELMAHRAMRYAGTAHFDRFGHGWMKRLFTIFKASQVTPP